MIFRKCVTRPAQLSVLGVAVGLLSLLQLNYGLKDRSYAMKLAHFEQNKAVSYNYAASPWERYEQVAGRQRSDRAVHEGRDRRHTFPFVTGDGFRMLADFSCDSYLSANPSCQPAVDEVKVDEVCAMGRAMIVFSDTEASVMFFATLFRVLVEAHKCDVVLILHNSDADAPFHGTEHMLEHPKLRMVFVQNPKMTHAKISAVPIGLENRYNHVGSKPETFISACAGVPPLDNDVVHHMKQRGPVVYANFRTGSYPPMRVPLWDKVRTVWHSWVASPVATTLAQEDLWREISRHPFVVAPRGNGLDTHRLWETLYLRRVPVVQQSPMDSLLRTLPVMIVPDLVADLTSELIQVSLDNVWLPDAISTGKAFIDHFWCSDGNVAHSAGRRDDWCDRRLRRRGEPKEAITWIIRIPEDW